MTAALIELAAGEYATVAAGLATVDLARQRLAELRTEERHAKEERDDITRRNDEDAAKRLLDGEEAAPRRPRRVSRLAALQERIPELAAAIRMQVDRVAALEVAAKQPNLNYIAAVLGLTGSIQGEAIDAMRATLATVAPHLAAVIAAGHVRAGTIGDRFPMPPGVTPPLHGGRVAQSFAAALPDWLRPAELDGDALLEAASQISQPILAAIKEGVGQ